MSDQDWIDLGRRAVACRGWRWMPGMLSGEIGRVVYTDPDCPGALVSSGCPSGPDWEENLDPPDFRDPATLGCLLALVREAWGSPQIGVVLYDGESHVHDGHCEDGLWIAGDDTEAAALVAALVAAPEPTR